MSWNSVSAGAVVLAAGIAVSGCAARTVERKFVASESCPSDRVTVVRTARPAWLPADPPPPPPPPPPPEVAADPERAAVYYREHPVLPAMDVYASRRFFLAQGCGHKNLYMCPGFMWEQEGAKDRARRLSDCEPLGPDSVRWTIRRP